MIHTSRRVCWARWCGTMKYLGLAHILADGFAGVGGVGAMIACLGPAHIRADRFAGVGGGWDDNVPWPLGTWLDTQDGAKRSESYGAKRSDSDGQAIQRPVLYRHFCVFWNGTANNLSIMQNKTTIGSFWKMLRQSRGALFNSAYFAAVLANRTIPAKVH